MYIQSAVRLFLASLLLFSRLPAAQPTVLSLHIHSPITPVTAEILSRSLEQAHAEGAALVIIRLNTPGGFMDSMQAMIQKMIASPLPVACWVGPSGSRAASAGFFLLEASDIAAMSPGTNTGAAHPVAMGREMDSVMKQKVENDAAAGLRSLVAQRGRNVELAQQAVLASRSFTEKEALDSHLIEFVASSEKELLNQIDGKEITRFNGKKQILHTGGAIVIPYGETVRERVLTFLSDPNLALIFLVIGALGIYAEFNAPGMVLPGVVGAICALLALSALSVLPVSWMGVSLIVLAFIFFGLELKVTSHGVLGAGGAVALTLGSLLLIDTTIPEMRIHLGTALGVTFPFALLTAFLLSLAARAKANKAVTGVEGMVGEIGVVVEPLSPQGHILIHGEYWNAVSAAQMLPGSQAKVTAIHGLQLSVEPVGASGKSLKIGGDI